VLVALVAAHFHSWLLSINLTKTVVEAAVVASIAIPNKFKVVALDNAQVVTS
jgi:predicted acylesterase/phospholipase RssA